MIRVLGFECRRSWEFLFTTVSRTALGPTQPPIQWIPRALSLSIKRPGNEAIPPFPQYDFMAWCLVKHRDNFTFNFIVLNTVLKTPQSMFNPENKRPSFAPITNFNFQ
jgi:hypothetical protein